MKLNSRQTIPNPDRLRFLSCIVVAGIVQMSVVLVAPLGMTNADNSQYAVVVRLDAKTGQTANEIAVRVEDSSKPASATMANPNIPKSIAIVIDISPDQNNVLSKEKELAIALINQFSDGGTTFTIVTAGISSTLQATLDRSAAINRLHDLAAASGVKTTVPIYDPIGSAIRQISLSPGLRIVVFIGEGNDGGSTMRYPELRSLAQSNQIAFFAALVADHSLRGTKSILRYGWNLRELTNDTAGIFLENEKTPKATRRLGESIRALRLISFDLPLLKPGRYKISVREPQGKRLRSQKAIVIP